MSECGPGNISGNSPCCAPSLLSEGRVAILTKTDGASYEPLITFGAKEDAMETASNTKSSAVKSYEISFKATETVVEGFREAKVVDTKRDDEAETSNFESYTVISGEGVKSNTETIADKGRGHTFLECNK